jgi:glutamine synthetase
MHHEVAGGQYEVVLGYSDALNLADRILYTKHLIKTIAEKHSMMATFMPKPVAGINGSGMHIHVSVRSTDGKNLFFDSTQEYYLSSQARKFINGLLANAREMNILFNNTPNSFKRLLPGYEAPFYLCAGNKNRSAAIRIPEVSPMNIKEHNGSAVRIELRWPDSNCNPYLALAGIFKAGLTATENDEKECVFINTNLYHNTSKSLEGLNLKMLPKDLDESINLAKESVFLQELLGEKLHGQLITEKQNVLNQYLEEVTNHDPLVITEYELEKCS